MDRDKMLDARSNAGRHKNTFDREEEHWLDLELLKVRREKKN
jgi:hypothetical protein